MSIVESHCIICMAPVDWQRQLEYANEQVVKLAEANAALADTEALRNLAWSQRFEAENQRDAANDALRNLLAIIHRDGGHYYTDHGSEKAVADAHQIWAALEAYKRWAEDVARPALARIDRESRQGFAGVWARQALEAYPQQEQESRP